MNKNDVDKFYVSPYDEFLARFDRDHEKSESQLKEIAKYQAIFAKRDGKISSESAVIWDEF
ncbi:MAG: hypothetical protein A3E88_00595 [Legionellales bacterium RIFCSPHIGHO2_12_FULL_35_11]|nr:MAG: hypothetical protein A3E88_00595 [Legionellales bacterium RIFCSPHIGHO2_12_FULL_35_11]